MYRRTGEAPGLAASLLALAEENGLPHLQACCLDFIAKHHIAVVSFPSFVAVTREASQPSPYLRHG